MPGPISDQHKGTPAGAPYVPTWCYPNNEPKVCPCGCHEGYHNDDGVCMRTAQCGCSGLPPECLTPMSHGYTSEPHGLTLLKEKRAKSGNEK